MVWKNTDMNIFLEVGVYCATFVFTHGIKSLAIPAVAYFINSLDGQECGMDIRLPPKSWKLRYQVFYLSKVRHWNGN